MPHEDVNNPWLGAAEKQGGAPSAQGGMPDRGEHPGAQWVDRLHLAKVADDRRWLLGQLLENGPPQLWSGLKVDPTGQE